MSRKIINKPTGRPKLPPGEKMDQLMIIRVSQQQKRLAELLGVALGRAGTSDDMRYLLMKASGEIIPIDPPAPGDDITQDFKVSPDKPT